MNSPKEKISMLGLGKLGLPTMAFLASRGCQTIGADVNETLVTHLQNNIVQSEEPGLRETYLKHRENIEVTTSIQDAVLGSNISFIIVPTPSSPTSGEFSAEFVHVVAEQIGHALQLKNDYHLVVLVSTVMPGDTKLFVADMIEEHSGKKCGKDFGVCYSPEFIALGSVLYNLAHPDFMLIGESDDRAGACLEAFQEKILPGIPKCRMNLQNAELAKIAVNTYVTTKISYANMLAEICEHMEGLDVNVITKAIGLDVRIGGKYLNAGLGYGGPCFPRDNKALNCFAKQAGAHAHLAVATDEVNRLQATRLVDRINVFASHSKNKAKKKVAILGVSYKLDTDVIEESQGIQIAQAIGYYSGLYGAVIMFDRPGALRVAAKTLHEDGVPFAYASALEDAVRDADIVVIAVPDKRFLRADTLLKNGGDGVLIVDPWRLFDETKLPAGAQYCTVGKCFP